MVEYSATFTILKPVDMTKGTGVLVYQVPNRGRANIEGAGYFADFRAQRPRAGDQRLAGRHPARPPASRRWSRRSRRNPDGSSITGPVMARIYDAPAGATTQPIIRGRVTGTATPASLDTTKATLTGGVGGRQPRAGARPATWAFADCAPDAVPRHAGSGEGVPEGRVRSGARSTSSPTSPRIRRCTASASPPRAT